MKIVVDTPEEYKKWLAGKPTVIEEAKAANTPAAPADANAKPADSAKATTQVVAVK